MQMDYLEHAVRFADASGADPVTKDVLAQWIDVLEKLESDPMQLDRELDWVIKRKWIEAYMARNRLSWRGPKVSPPRPPHPPTPPHPPPHTPPPPPATRAPPTP